MTSEEKTQLAGLIEKMEAAIAGFRAGHSPEVCECDIEGGDPECKIEPKCPTPYEWETLCAPVNLSLLIRAAKEDEWIPVSERPPEPGVYWLVIDERHKSPVAHPAKALIGRGGQLEFWWASAMLTVTHWRPLPAPPKEKP